MAPQQPFSVEDVLDTKETIAPLFPVELLQTPPLKIDVSKNNEALRHMKLLELGPHIAVLLEQSRRSWAYGGWGEERLTNQSNDSLEHGASGHVLHLGLDIWLPAGTAIFSPVAGVIHRIQEDQPLLNYGPTIVTQHSIAGAQFFIMYRHVSRESLNGLSVGQRVRLGDRIAATATAAERSVWPSHLHLQIIPQTSNASDDLQSTIKISDKDTYLHLYPNPESLFRSFVHV